MTNFRDPVSTLPPCADSFYRRRGKRILDIGLALAAIPFAVPVMVLFMLILIAQGKRPIGSQICRGRNGRIFRLWMIPADSDGKAGNETGGAFLQFLHQSSLDGLPRLYNVLRGDISTVGARPPAPGESRLSGKYLSDDLAPGLTGPWQFPGRECDRSYGRFLSLRGDLDLLRRCALNDWDDPSPLATDK